MSKVRQFFADKAKSIKVYPATLASCVKTKDGNDVQCHLDQVSGDNLLINGDFQVWQRGETFTGAGYCADRWRISKPDGASIKVSKSIDGIAFEATNDGYVQMDYFMEANDTYALKGEHLTLSYKASSTLYSIKFRIKRGNTWIVVGTANASGTTFLPEIQSGDILNITILIKKNMTLNYVKLECGEVATPFISRSYGNELLLCQRYFYPIVKKGRDFQTFGTLIKYDGAMHGMVFLPNLMRVYPTIKFSGNLCVFAIKDFYNIVFAPTSFSMDENGYVKIISSNADLVKFPNGISMLIQGQKETYVYADAEIY